MTSMLPEMRSLPASRRRSTTTTAQLRTRSVRLSYCLVFDSLKNTHNVRTCNKAYDDIIPNNYRKNFFFVQRVPQFGTASHHQWLISVLWLDSGGLGAVSISAYSLVFNCTCFRFWCRVNGFFLRLPVSSAVLYMNEMNEWKCSDLKCIQKPRVGLV